MELIPVTKTAKMPAAGEHCDLCGAGAFVRENLLAVIPHASDCPTMAEPTVAWCARCGWQWEWDPREFLQEPTIWEWLIPHRTHPRCLPIEGAGA